jgi:hypothetical protein
MEKLMALVALRRHHAANHTQTPSIETVEKWIESGEPRSVIDVLVTPDLAQALLKRNLPGESNRKLRQPWVKWTKDAIEAGTWTNTGEPIIVSADGILNDGQHRLMAVVQSGLPTIMDLRFGVAREAFAATNSGARRSAADALHLLGHHSSAVALSSAARMVLCYQHGLPQSIKLRTGNDEIVRAVERWPDLHDAVRSLLNSPKKLANGPLHAAIFFLGRIANESTVNSFAEVLKYGEGRRTDPPHALREAALRMGSLHDRDQRAILMALAIKAVNAYRNGERITKLEWNRKSEAFPVVRGLKI